MTPSPTLTGPEEAWIFLTVFLGVVGIFRWGSVLLSKVVKQRRLRRNPDEELTQVPITRSQASSRRLPARLLLAALNAFRVVAFRWTIGFCTYDLEVTDIFLMLAYAFFLNIWIFEGTLKFELSKTNIALWSENAGRLAASQFPLVTALGTKNNIVSLVTGVSYEKLNLFHRVTARMCFGLLFIHAGAKIYDSESFKPYSHQPFLHFGLAAFISLAILVVVAIRRIRTRIYEVFFHAHFILVFVFLLGAYFHTKHTNNSNWIWPCFLFWALDRFMRTARVLVYNHLYCWSSRPAKLQDATTELLSDDFIRVRVRRPTCFRWCPGQVAYLTVPSISIFPLEAHPFYIWNIDSSLFHPGTNNEDSAKREGATGTETTEAAHWKELVFLIHVRGGFTKRLKQVAAQNKTVKLFIDGLYGRAPDMGIYDTSIFVAGTSGIAYTLPVFLNMIEEAQKATTQCRRVVFIWVIRDASHVQWISDALCQANAVTPTWLNVSTRIFVTRGEIPSNESPVDREGLPEEGSHNWKAPPFIQLEKGRPDLMAILRDEVSTATGSMSVTVCGSLSVTRSVRRALRFPVSSPYSILNGGPSVTLHVEPFRYA